MKSFHTGIIIALVVLGMIWLASGIYQSVRLLDTPENLPAPLVAMARKAGLAWLVGCATVACLCWAIACLLNLLSKRTTVADSGPPNTQQMRARAQERPSHEAGEALARMAQQKR